MSKTEWWSQTPRSKPRSATGAYFNLATASPAFRCKRKQGFDFSREYWVGHPFREVCPGRVALQVKSGKVSVEHLGKKESRLKVIFCRKD